MLRLIDEKNILWSKIIDYAFVSTRLDYVLNIINSIVNLIGGTFMTFEWAQESSL